MDVHLTERQQKILWATVNYYIATAEPVGSQALAKEYEFSLSPATIRNVMGMLEKSGLLYQPHTSAGRVPSDSGYRLYVDELITPSHQLVHRVQQLLNKRLNPGQTSFETLVRHAAQILATLSGCIALITLPQPTSAAIRHLHLVQVEPQRVMVILVTDSYETHTVFMNLPAHLYQDENQNQNEEAEELIKQELQLLSNFLNHQLSGKLLSELSELDWHSLDRQFQAFAESLKQLFGDLSQRTHSSLPSPILVGGLAEFLRQPEFSELAQAQNIIQMLEEEQDQLWPLMYEQAHDPSSLDCRPNSPIQIRIGAENPLKPIQNCALVSSIYQRGKAPVGSVGVLGPTRMAYDKVIAFVEGTANFLSATISRPL
ncbi:MAG: heat-inducible transcriptional repressor HrcA [Thermosynechococcaceae cyanobacterium MS004]|nr:heat-inducible transcriptional repressor HrcA [Thermosynechococcaceae cyanobacterium MS004]